MPSVRILTKDIYLYQKIFLLLEESYEIITDGSYASDLTLVDTDTYAIPSGTRIITMSHSGESMLKIPFSRESLLSLLDGDNEEGAPLSIDGRRARLLGKEVRLTEVEAALLSCLIEAGGETVSKEELLSRVWGEGTDSGVVNVYVHYLREKLEGGGEKVILSARGVGYRISKKFVLKGGRTDA